MESLDSRMETLEARLDREARWGFIRTLLFVSVPVLAALVLLWVVVEDVKRARSGVDLLEDQLAAANRAMAASEQRAQELESALSEAQSAEQSGREQLAAATQANEIAKQEIDALRLEITQLEEMLQKSANFAWNTYERNWTDRRFLEMQPPAVAELLTLVREFQSLGVGWHRANRPELGYRSPAFAGHVLQQLGRLPADGEPAAALGSLPVGAAPPAPGDVILYDGDYAMFFFRDGSGREFVVGMTPVGIAALAPEFGPARRGVIKLDLAAGVPAQ